MKQFIRLFLWVLIPMVLWFTRHYTSYPQALSKAQVDYQLPTPYYLQANDYNEHDIAWAKQFLNDSIRLNTESNTEEKIEQLGNYLISTLHPYMHESSGDLMQQTPAEQFKQIRYQHASFYCSNYVAIYGFFARVAGLAVRDIELKSNTRWHIVSETWSEESKRWLLTDLTHQLPLVRTTSGKALSLFDAQKLEAITASAQADYAAEANLYVHKKNNALHLQSAYNKVMEFVCSSPNILLVQEEPQANQLPVLLKYLALGAWIFLSIRILRGRA
jgi:hypothetical protein